MPCLVLTGHPCVGKTYVAEALKERALKKQVKHVEIVNEERACVDHTKSECYADSLSEKKTRGALKSQVDSLLKKDTLVIVDSLNYIKGYRYELFCMSKAQQDRHGVIWILNDPATAKEWNSKIDNRYTDEQMEELIMRYEPPDARNRWDKPLYHVDLSPNKNDAASNVAARQDALQRSVYNMHSLSDAIEKQESTVPKRPSAAGSFKRAAKQRPSNNRSMAPTESNATPGPAEPLAPPQRQAQSLEERLDEILDSFLHDIEPLKEGTSTKQFAMADANVLNEVDRWTQQVCQAVVKAQQQGDRVGPLILSLKNSSMIMKRPSRTVPSSELSRLRQEYLRWAASHPPDDTSEKGVMTAFIKYLEERLK